MGNQNSDQRLKKDSIIFKSNQIGKELNGNKQELINLWHH